MICKSCVPGSVSEIACEVCRSAKIREDGSVLCGSCGHKIAEYGNGIVKIKCKHKSSGKTCNEISEIIL